VRQLENSTVVDTRRWKEERETEDIVEKNSRDGTRESKFVLGRGARDGG